MADPEGDTTVGAGIAGGSNDARASTPDASSIPPAPTPSTPNKKGKGKEKAAPALAADAGLALPDAFTPSINKTLNMLGGPDAAESTINVPPLPAGLTVAQMKTRLGGKAKIK